MTPPFSVRTSPHFDRLAEALTRRQPDFPARYDRAREILGNDPYNRTRRHHIKEIEGIPAGAGQWWARTRLMVTAWVDSSVPSFFRKSSNGEPMVLFFLLRLARSLSD